MQTATMTQPHGGLSLVETITHLRTEFANMRSELVDAHTEIVRLSSELAGLKRERESITNIDLGSLRRKVAFYCHPDRGGDSQVMCRLNVLFDLVESIERLPLELAAEGM